MRAKLALIILLLIAGTAVAQSLAWNTNARQFIFAPAFDFQPVAGAHSYRFELTPKSGQILTFHSDGATASLAPIWAQLPVGPVSLRVQALDASGKVIGLAGSREFHHAAPFHPPVEQAKVSYTQSEQLALKNIVDQSFVRKWLTSNKPDSSYGLYRYSSKILGSLMTACAMYAEQSPRPADADEVLQIGQHAADFLISISRADGPLAGMPPTYHDAKPTERENDNWTMMMTPAEAARGYLDLHDATRDAKYLDAAIKIADAYRRLQLASGTWPLKVDNRTNQPLGPVDLIPTEAIDFLERIVKYNHPEFSPTLDRAVQWVMANPARTWNWQAQFDDAKMRGAYENLSKHEACMFAGYLLRNAGDDKEKIALAHQLLLFAEDQFVIWGKPPESSSRFEKLDNWFTPSSAEQYAMFEPISGSSAFMIMAWVREHEITHDPLPLEKAKALADELIVAQQYNHGQYPTRMYRKPDRTWWLNSSVNTIRAMRMLEESIQHETTENTEKR